jgi:hypothetical protein
MSDNLFIEVRDSRTGYFIPVRYGIGVWPDGRVVAASWPSSSASSGNSGRLSGWGTILGVVHMVLRSTSERYLEMETGVLLGIPIQIL